MSLATAAREYVWLWDHRHGLTAESIASREKLSVGRVLFGLSRAKAQERGVIAGDWRPDFGSVPRAPWLVPMFPIGAYTPKSACGHRRAIPAGSAFCCMVCHQSGMDDHPALERDPRSDPAPEPFRAEPVASPSPACESSKAQTRKERRSRQFAHRRPSSEPSPGTREASR